MAYSLLSLSAHINTGGLYGAALSNSCIPSGEEFDSRRHKLHPFCGLSTLD